MNTKNLKNIFSVFNIYFISKFLSLTKFFGSKVIGSFFLFLSPITFILPALSISTHYGYLAILLNSLYRFFLIGKFSAILAIISPFAATLYWHNKKIRFILPLFSFIMFIVHPIGYQAIFYAMLWIIPFSIALISKPNNLQLSLGSSFASHALCSVIWLYCFPEMSALIWVSLIPKVLLERLLITTGLYITINLLNNPAPIKIKYFSSSKQR